LLLQNTIGSTSISIPKNNTRADKKNVKHHLHRFLRFEELSLAEARLLARRPRAGDGTMPLFNASLSEPAQKRRRGRPPKDQQAGTSGTAPGR
jgi:hypothetical protein